MEGKSEKAGTDIFSEKMLQKEEGKGENKGSGDETTLFGVRAHTTQFSLHMQSGSSQSFLRD